MQTPGSKYRVVFITQQIRFEFNDSIRWLIPMKNSGTGWVVRLSVRLSSFD